MSILFEYTITPTINQIKNVQNFLEKIKCSVKHTYSKEYYFEDLILEINLQKKTKNVFTKDIKSINKFNKKNIPIHELIYTYNEKPISFFPGLIKYVSIKSIEKSSFQLNNIEIILKSITHHYLQPHQDMNLLE